MSQPSPHRPQSPRVSAVGYFIFFSRWLQAPLYIGLIVAQAIYVVVFMVELWDLGARVSISSRIRARTASTSKRRPSCSACSASSTWS